MGRVKHPEWISPLAYAVYGVLCAAKVETGPHGARRMYRIQERLNNWNDDAVIEALKELYHHGMLKCDMGETFPGLVYYEAYIPREGDSVSNNRPDDSSPDSSPVLE